MKEGKVGVMKRRRGEKKPRVMKAEEEGRGREADGGSDVSSEKVK